MKRNLFMLLFAAAMCGIVLCSYEHGPAYEGGINRTGSQGGAANCMGSGCHGANTPTTIVDVKVYNSAGGIITQYQPGVTYTVAITGVNTAASLLTEFGFQVSAVLSNAAQAGSFTIASGADLRVTSLGGLQIVEHKHALEDSVTNYFVARFSWTAPAAGSGDVKFYGILNPIGESGHKLTDDEDDEDEISLPNTAPVITLIEGNGYTNAVATTNSEKGFVLYPNPCKDALNVVTTAPAAYDVYIYSAGGGVVGYGKSANNFCKINMQDLPMGLYTVVIKSENFTVIKSVLRQ